MAQKASPKKRKRPGSQSADTRRKIIDAALAIAAEKGFEMATTAEIARHAGVAEGSIYNYFRTKDDLLVQMVGEYAGSFLEALSDTIASEQSPVGKIDRLIRFHIWFFTKYSLCRLVRLLKGVMSVIQFLVKSSSCRLVRFPRGAMLLM